MLATYLKGATAAVKPSIVFNYGNASAQSSSTYTYNNISIGAASSNRVVVVFVVASDASSRSVSSISIGGTAATLGTNTQITGLFLAGMGYRVVSSGTTANVVITFSGSVRDVGVFVYSLYDLKSEIPLDTDNSPSSSGASKTLTMTTEADGIVIGSAIAGATVTSYTWTAPLIADSTLTNISRIRGSASAISSGASTNVTVTPNSSNFMTLIAATWR
jgi:hypothetical protein